jgi:hypothetical protein
LSCHSPQRRNYALGIPLSRRSGSKLAGVGLFKGQGSMKKLLLLMLLLASTMAWGADKSERYQTMGVRSCEIFVQAQREDSWAKITIEAWIAGYITAYNYQTPNTYNILANRELDSIMLWLDNWCRANPREDLAGGMVVLTEELYPDRHKTPTEVAAR